MGDMLGYRPCPRCGYVRRVSIRTWSTLGPALCSACQAEDAHATNKRRVIASGERSRRLRREQNERIARRPAGWTPPPDKEIVTHAYTYDDNTGEAVALCGKKGRLVMGTSNCPKCRQLLAKGPS